MALVQKTTDIQQLQTQRIGYMAVSLTEYDSDLEPAVAEGSVLEIAGALFEAAADEPITGWGAIGNNNDVYVKINAGTLGAEFTLVAPTWSTTKQGWYDGLDRYVGGLRKDAAGAYAFKQVYGGFSAGRHPIGEVGDLVSSVNLYKPGLLWCDGSTISNVANPIYARLIYQLKKEAGADAAHPLYHVDADKAVLPDFRGYAIRGKTGAAVAARDQDGDRKVGAYQADGNKTHSHNVALRGVAGAQLTVEKATATIAWTAGLTASSGNTEATMKNATAYILVKF